MCNSAPDSPPSELRPLQLLLADCIDPLQLLFPVCVRFSCCSPLVSASAATPRLRPFQLLADCVRFGCCSSIASSTAAPASHLQLPDCVRFGCCSPIASASTAAPRLHPLNACSLTCSGRFQPMPNVLERSPRSSRFSKLKYEGRASLQSNPAPRTSHFRHTRTHTHTHIKILIY